MALNHFKKSSRRQSNGGPDHRALDLLLPAAVGALVVLVGALSSKLKLSVSLTALAFVATASMVAALTSSLFARFTSRGTDHWLSDASSFGSLESLLRLSTSLLIEDPDLSEFEASVECSQIWIISPDLHKDVGAESFRDVVADNIRCRNIRYTWILNGTHPGIMATVRELKSGYNEEELTRIRCVVLNHHDWVCLPYTSGDFAVYNPTREPSATETRLYYEYPDEKRALWIRVFSPVIEQWIDQLEAVVPDLDIWDNEC